MEVYILKLSETKPSVRDTVLNVYSSLVGAREAAQIIAVDSYNKRDLEWHQVDSLTYSARIREDHWFIITGKEVK